MQGDSLLQTLADASRPVLAINQLQGLANGAALPTDGVVQRVIDEPEFAGTRIKIWIDDTIETVFLARDFTPGDGTVSYTSEDPSKDLAKQEKANRDIIHADRRKKNPRTVSPPSVSGTEISVDHAFPLSTKDAEIIREMDQAAEFEAAANDLDVDISPEVITYLTDLVEHHKGLAEDEITVTKARILALATELAKDNEIIGTSVDVTSERAVDQLKELLGETDADYDAFEAGEDYYIDQIIEFMTGTRTPEATGGGDAGEGSSSSKADWKTDQTKTERNLVKAAIDPLEVARLMLAEATLHHKISRSQIKLMLEELGRATNDTPGVAAMYTFLGQISVITGKGDREVAMENWTANIELGVHVDHRAEGDDPKEGFDGNYQSDGTATPRTAELEEAALIIANIGGGAPVNWVSLAAHLNAAKVQHQAMVAEEKAFTAPKLDQWKNAPDSKFTRRKKGEVD